MRSLFVAAFLLWQGGTLPVTADQQYLRYERVVQVPMAGTACAVIDPMLFPHSAPSLKDLRVYQDGREVPYAITLSEPQQQDSDMAQVRNAGLKMRNVVFDLEMPKRPYSQIDLDLAGQDFIATATVTGTRDPNYANQTSLGEFTLFDLTGQHLGRNTSIHLQETDLPYLHIELAITPAAGTHTFDSSPEALQKMVREVTVPPSREAQSIYTTAVVSSSITQKGRETLAAFTLPERIPVERISFELDRNFKGNFSRDVRVSDRPSPVTTLDASSETLAGTILRVHLTQAGKEIKQEQLSIPATLGSNLQSAAAVQVAIENGDDVPLPVTAVRLEMRQRKLCFEAASAAPLTLFYGDPALTAPQYDFARLWSPTSAPHSAQLGEEKFNPVYHRRPDMRPVSERHPHLLWAALLFVLCCLAVVAIRSSKTVHHP